MPGVGGESCVRFPRSVFASLPVHGHSRRHVFLFQLCRARQRSLAVTFGVGFDDARFFRGRETPNKGSSGCPDGPCCRRPTTEANSKWNGNVIASPRAQTRITGLLSPEPYPSLDLAEICEIADNRRSHSGRRPGCRLRRSLQQVGARHRHDLGVIPKLLPLPDPDQTDPLSRLVKAWLRD